MPPALSLATPSPPLAPRSAGLLPARCSGVIWGGGACRGCLGDELALLGEGRSGLGLPS